jgi:hypothetical protein
MTLNAVDVVWCSDWANLVVVRPVLVCVMDFILTR